MLQTVCTITLQRGGGFTHFLSSGFIKAIVMNRPDGKQRNTPLLALHCVDGHVALKRYLMTNTFFDMKSLKQHLYFRLFLSGHICFGKYLYFEKKSTFYYKHRIK